jgi:hypothetical protein
MGDMGDLYNDLRQHRRDIRDRFGVNCPKCAEVRPKACPSILLPGQRCKVDRYVDPRPRLTDEQQGIVRQS